jgi:single-strand DNA-binding protein
MQLNQLNINGYLGKDGAKNIGSEEAPICAFSLGNDQSYTDKEGKRVEQTEWLNVVVFGGLAKPCLDSLKKGSHVGVYGAKIRTRNYEDKEGVNRTVVEAVVDQRNGQVAFLDKKES